MAPCQCYGFNEYPSDVSDGKDFQSENLGGSHQNGVYIEDQLTISYQKTTTFCCQVLRYRQILSSSGPVYDSGRCFKRFKELFQIQIVSASVRAKTEVENDTFLTIKKPCQIGGTV